LQALRADALARNGDAAAAERAFREELRLFPGEVEAYRGLIVLLASQGRTEDATRAIREFAAASPNKGTYEVIAQTLDVIGDREGAVYWRSR
jgi:Flp pilus assembly protein TadD